MTKLNNHLRELKLLILSMVIFILSIFATTYADIPIGNNRVKEQLDDFFQTRFLPLPGANCQGEPEGSRGTKKGGRISPAAKSTPGLFF